MSWLMIASCCETATASLSTRADVGADGGVDRGRDVGVGRDRTVDRGGDVGVRVHVDVHVEQVAVELAPGPTPLGAPPTAPVAPSTAPVAPSTAPPTAPCVHAAGGAVDCTGGAVDRTARQRRCPRRRRTGRPGCRPQPAGAAVAAAGPAAAVSAPWSSALSWVACAVGVRVRAPWWISTPWSLSAWALESTESTLAPTAASIGAATLALAADGEVDRGGRVDGQVDVGVQVEDRDDLLVGQGGGPVRAELLVGQADRLVVVHGSPSRRGSRAVVWCRRYIPLG